MVVVWGGGVSGLGNWLTSVVWLCVWRGMSVWRSWARTNEADDRASENLWIWKESQDPILHSLQGQKAP